MNEQELQQLLQTICDVLQVKIEDVKGLSRKSNLIDVRTIFVAKANMSFPKKDYKHYVAIKIMRIINRDRTLFYCTIERYLNYLQFNDPFLQKVKQVERALKEVQSVAA